ncbi:uncharacterized protein LOC119888599 isoform X2 [Micropterus salmoides]|uniref:uncharacterized protein LOC119888599 isoform X2 n=1 Tax=Micropterus salmoides TaxID=27706 RepID=UPI0018EBACDF|nr:uncharacterized protein LOC119888599 isoform X2 [Micropterus salmoides]
MSAVWVKLITILCLSCTALSDPAFVSIHVESSGVVWGDTGGAVTIQCRLPKSQLNQEVLILKKGLSEKNEVLHIDGDSGKNTTATKFQGRLQLNGVFPNMDILIKNLTSDDTGPYWCKYKRFDQGTAALVTTEGNGSVLLVVTVKTDTSQQCEPSNKNMVLVAVVISTAVLLGIMIFLLTWTILKVKTRCNSVKPRHVATNDVYEDMRGTLRR